MEGKVRHLRGGRRRFTLNDGTVIMYTDIQYTGKCADPEHWGDTTIRSGSWAFYNVAAKKTYCCTHAPRVCRAIENNMTLQQYLETYHKGDVKNS
jgi:hypothetical protein